MSFLQQPGAIEEVDEEQDVTVFNGTINGNFHIIIYADDGSAVNLLPPNAADMLAKKSEDSHIKY